VIDEPLSKEDLLGRLNALQAGVELTEHKTFEPIPRAPVVRPEDTWEWNHSFLGELEVVAPERKHEPRYVWPLTQAAEAWIEISQDLDGRWAFGLPPLDHMTRGVGNGELMYVTGFAHSGKTQLVLRGMIANRQRPFVLFTFDEPRELVLAKLTSMVTNRDGEDLERGIRDKDSATLSLVRDVAAKQFGKLIVVDQLLPLSDMTVALKEAEDFLGEPVAAVGIDYLELLRCEETEVDKKSQALKGWVKQVNKPVICLHQGSRGNAGKGQTLSMQSMKYGGEQEATFVVGVRRKRDDGEMFADHPDWDSVSISVLKNKRPPSRKGEHDYRMSPATGNITELGDLRIQHQRTFSSQAGLT
jgi:hypothetical protein